MRSTQDIGRPTAAPPHRQPTAAGHRQTVEPTGPGEIRAVDDDGAGAVGPETRALLAACHRPGRPCTRPAESTGPQGQLGPPRPAAAGTEAGR
jgi:hypothetical protein